MGLETHNRHACPRERPTRTAAGAAMSTVVRDLQRARAACAKPTPKLLNQRNAPFILSIFIALPAEQPDGLPSRPRGQDARTRPGALIDDVPSIVAASVRSSDVTAAVYVGGGRCSAAAWG
jgi:hypothetical protein